MSLNVRIQPSEFRTSVPETLISRTVCLLVLQIYINETRALIHHANQVRSSLNSHYTKTISVNYLLFS